VKEAFIDKRFKRATKEFLADVLAVVDRYAQMGYKMSLRQLYYQMVTEKVIPNQQKYYAKLSKVLSDARLCGIVDWDIIEDRTRRPYRKSNFQGAKELMESAIYSLRLPRHYDQENYVELWTEKDALYSVLQPIADDYHVPLVVNRGYSSSSAMYRSFNRFRYKHQKPIIIYLGDHDPSGLDMDRDINDRMEMFGVEMKIDRLALTKSQINKHSLPPDPAKITDPRIRGYIEEHGKGSWEVDALSPPILDKLVRSKLETYIDMDKYNAWIPREDEIKAQIQDFADDLGNFDFDSIDDE
jgi:hypothetical protein